MTKTAALIKHRYKPVSEFDEVTLASKREYWRNKKREQRARLSKAKKKVRAPNTGVCKPVCTDGRAPQKSNCDVGPALLNNDASFQSGVAQNQTKGMVTAAELNKDSSMDKPNGAPLTKGLALPAACTKAHPTGIKPRQTPNTSSTFNGNLLSISVSHLAPRCSRQVSEIKCCVTPKSSEFAECKFDKKQSAVARTNTNTNASASVPLFSMVACKTAEVAMTEEERVAKRRENWRVKKREQRAKRAEKLKMNREKMQCFKKGQQETGTFPCAAAARSLSSVNTVALRKAKPLNYGVAQGKVHLPPQSPCRPQSAALNLADRQRLLAKNISVYSRSQFQSLKQNHMAISSGVPMQPLRSTQAIGQSRMPQQKFVRIQRVRGLPQGNETAEERLAKQREYWRIKKREQRAKRSLASKGRLKDRDAFNWRAKRYQIMLEQMRKTPTGLHKMPQSNKDTLSVVKSSSCPAMSQKVIQTRARPVLHSIPNSTNISTNQQITRRSAVQNVTACGPVDVSKLASGTEDVRIRLTEQLPAYSEQLRPEYRTTFKEELESCDSRLDVTPSLDLTACDATKQEPTCPPVDTCSLAEQNHTMNVKEINSAPSFYENNSEAEPCSTNESQSTTLLVVASMKKLLEESLSSAGDSNSTSADKCERLPCKTEDKSFPREEHEMDRKADLAEPQELSTDTYPSVAVPQSPPPCHSPQQTHNISSDGPDLSCHDSSLQPSCTASCLDKSPGDERCVNFLHSDTSALGGKTSGPQSAFPPQTCGAQQLNENSELQKKREYWRVMKRQQRARKAKEMEKRKDALHPSQRKYGSSQGVHLPVAQKINHTPLNNPVIPPDVTLRCARPVLSPTVLSNQQPSNGTRRLLCEGQNGKTSEMSRLNNQQLQVQGNDFSSAARPGTVTSMPTNHAKPPDPRIQTRGSAVTKFKINQSQLETTASQEPGLDEDVQRRRMHWRIKKQEQRARKAAREKALSHQTTFNQTRHTWSNNSTHVVQSIPERLNYPPDQCQTASVKDEACYLPDDDCLDEPLSEDKWRTIYLMDFDPVNQLLVCMVCGEQQYTFSVEEVRAHIEETHPGTLSLEEAERRRILKAWDEQVAMRERFFTNQLWQNSGVLKEQSSRRTAEIEVILGQDDKADQSK